MRGPKADDVDFLDLHKDEQLSLPSMYEQRRLVAHQLPFLRPKHPKHLHQVLDVWLAVCERGEIEDEGVVFVEEFCDDIMIPPAKVGDSV